MMREDDGPVFRIEANGETLDASRRLFGIGDARCRGDPDGGVRELEYAGPCVAVVLDGAFDYTGSKGGGLASRGALLFGNSGEAFRFRFSDRSEIRRGVVALPERTLREIAEDCGLDDPAFPFAVLPSRRSTMALYGAVRRAAAGLSEAEEVLDLTAEALTLGRNLRVPEITERQTRRVREVVEHMHERYAEPCTLDELATLAQLSRYHFIRVFRAAIGENPHQHLVGIRLRAALDILADSSEAITSIAFDVGFNDISNFNATFRQAFGMSPSQWRAADGRRAA